MFFSSAWEAGGNIFKYYLSSTKYIYPTQLRSEPSPTMISRLSKRAFSSVSNNFVRIVDVSPRDGLQNEKNPVSTDLKLDLIDRLTKCGVPEIEVTSFVSPKWIPQMADHDSVYSQVLKKYSGNGVRYPVLTPNLKGLDSAIASAESVGQKVQEVAIFGAASEGFNKKNTNRSIAESFAAFEDVIKKAQGLGITVRGYLSTVIACPYDGPTNPAIVAELSKQLLDMGCREVSLGDTIGVGTPATIERMLEAVLAKIPAEKLAIHAHDTYGQGVANVVKAVEMGIRVVDSSVAGLGGCPYAKGATGNVSTEDVVYTLEGLGFQTGIDLKMLSQTGKWVSEAIGRNNGSRAGAAICAKL